MEPAQLKWFDKTPRRPRPERASLVSGAMVATLLTAAILHAWQRPGEPVPPSLNAARFTVAVLSGPKQAAQEAPSNAAQVVTAVEQTPVDAAAQVVTAERENSLPEAVAAAVESAPGPEVLQQDEVIPPARVSMPGGRLMAEDAGLGNQPDPFAVGPQQVYLRLFVDNTGKVVRGGIARAGTEPLRDALILKAMTSRRYAPDGLRIKSPDGLWQLDLVIDYGSNEFLP